MLHTHLQSIAVVLIINISIVLLLVITFCCNAPIDRGSVTRVHQVLKSKIWKLCNWCRSCFSFCFSCFYQSI